MRQVQSANASFEERRSYPRKLTFIGHPDGRDDTYLTDRLRQLGFAWGVTDFLRMRR